MVLIREDYGRRSPGRAEYIIRLIKPERPGLYSIASSPVEEGKLRIKCSE